MYEYIKGRYIGINKDYIIVENNGIGYKIFTSGATMAEMPKVNEEIMLYLEQIVREDFIGLYGFKDREELEMFKLLISISGVGAKAALSLLSISRINNLKYAIIMEDDKHLCRAPGIGKKTAQKLILELKDKIDLEEVFETKQEHVRETEGKMESKKENDAKKDAVDALTALGYSSTEALRAVRQIGVTPDMDVETILKLALKNMNL